MTLLQLLILIKYKWSYMSRIEYQTDINAQVEKVYEYYTNPNNIQEAWPRDIVKESENVSGSKGEEGDTNI
jgi:uncharacterized protein YndB with AHSA1/START domain